jgi:hypothetical protein
MTARTLIEPAAFDPFICQLLTSVVEPERLYSSMNSSLPPFGPRVRNSLITTLADVALEIEGNAGQIEPRNNEINVRSRSLILFVCLSSST